MSSSRTNPSKKVRLACQRCRVRRIKCDGQVPSCGNCSKADEACIDVDDQNSDLLIPRNFANAARARIQWLEGIIREKLPHVDLTEGPQVGVASNSKQATTRVGFDAQQPRQSTTGAADSHTDSNARRQSSKRTHGNSTSSEPEESLQEGAHSIATNLGMLSLNSDSSQKHYLGSSSGLLFSNLIGASHSSNKATPDTTRHTDATFELYHHAVSAPSVHKRCQSLQALLKQHLPPRQDAFTMVQTYIRESHPDFPILDPTGLFGALEALYEYSSLDMATTESFINDWPASVKDFRWNGQNPNTSKLVGKGVPMPVIAFTMFMVCNIAVIVKVRARVYEFSPEKFYRAALLFSGDCFSQISLCSIQALVILIVHSIYTPAEVSLWTLIHVAMAQCVELGIHRQTEHFHENEKGVEQIKRFVFYTIYSLERSVSAIQGRPLGFRDETFDVKYPEESLINEELEKNLIPAFFSADVVRYSVHQFKLDRIVSDIKLHLYHLPVDSIFPLPRSPTAHQTRIQKALQAWWELVLENGLGLLSLDARQEQTWCYKLKNRFNAAMVLLFQPSQSIRHPAEASLRVCFECASNMLENFKILYDNRCLHFCWRTVQNIFAAGATLVYAFWTSKSVQCNTSIVGFSRSLRVCSSLLSVGGEWWPSVRAGKNSLETVVDLTIRKLYTLDRPLKQRRLTAKNRLSVQQHDAERSGHEISATASQGAPLSVVENWTEAAFDTFPTEIDSTEPLAEEQLPQWSAPLAMTADNQNYHSTSEEWQMYSDHPSSPAEAPFGMEPEIQDFLADFNNSEFSWNFPLNEFEAHSDAIDFSNMGVGGG